MIQGVSSAELKQLKSIFDLFDDGGSGRVAAATLKATLLAAAQKHPDSAGDPKQYYATVVALDQYQNKTIEFEQFVEIFAATSPTGQRDAHGRITREEAFRLFRLVDVDNKGRIGYLELKTLMEDIGELVAPEELQEMLFRADLNGDGYIDAVSLGVHHRRSAQEEFYTVMTCRHSFVEES